jgi:hypothetical protein
MWARSSIRETAPFAAAMLRAIDDNALTLAVRASPVRVYQEATIGEAIATLSREGTLDAGPAGFLKQ